MEMRIGRLEELRESCAVVVVIERNVALRVAPSPNTILIKQGMKNQRRVRYMR